MSTLQLLSHIQHLQATLATVWMGLSELFTVATMLWILNATARAIRIVYAAGLWTGHICKRYIVPAILWTADHISAALSHVDWVEVRTVFVSCAKVIIAAVLAATAFVIYHLRRDIPTAYAWVERNFIDLPLADLNVQSIVHVPAVQQARPRPVGFAS